MAGYIGSKSSVTLVDGITKNGGTLEGDLSFGDNDKAKFGAGDDLQIYSDGTHSRIYESGSGLLIVRASNFNVNNADGTDSYITMQDGGAVTAYYDGSAKLATTSTGVDVTGETSAGSRLVLQNKSTGVEVNSSIRHHTNNYAYMFGGTNGLIFANNTGEDTRIKLQDSNEIEFITSSTNRMVIDSSGRVTKPYQPSFAASKNNGHLTSGTMIYNDVRHNVGSHYNSSNGRFTAPVTGRYFIGSMLMSHNDATYNNASYNIAKNGNTIQYVYSSSGSAVHHQWHWSGIISLSANDYVTIVYNNVKMYGESSGYSWFSGHLLG